jgi:hypothetical protein
VDAVVDQWPVGWVFLWQDELIFVCARTRSSKMILISFSKLNGDGREAAGYCKAPCTCREDGALFLSINRIYTCASYHSRIEC